VSFRDNLFDEFLQGLSDLELSHIEDKLDGWGLKQDLFIRTFDRWFANFHSVQDRELALKVLLHIKYYNESQFNEQIQKRCLFLQQHLHKSGRSPSDVLLVTPVGQADSAHRHAYAVVKEFSLPRTRVVPIDELGDIKADSPIIVLFNDTHGSGNQFMTQVWPYLKDFPQDSIFLFSVVMAEKALSVFREELPGVHLNPTIPQPSAWTQFTGEECRRLQQLGEEVYSKHPMGYGDTALLVAYPFQCPNSSLPIIWADGKNNEVDGKAFPWNPLFPYRPKISTPGADQSEMKNVVRKIDLTVGTANARSGKPAAKAVALDYKYRVALLDLDLGLTNLAALADALNTAQRYLLFTTPPPHGLKSSTVTIGGIRCLDAWGMPDSLYAEFDDLAVDLVVCLTRYPLAFGDKTTWRYNYFSGPSNRDRRFMFVSANQLHHFCMEAEYRFEAGLAHIIVGQLVVYFTRLGYHRETRACPMDFCETRADKIHGLRLRRFCENCSRSLGQTPLQEALEAILQWNP